MSTDSKITLDGVAMRVNPSEVRWNFKMKVSDKQAVGGKVIQILGVKLSDLTVKGRYSPDRKEGDTESWQQQVRFREQVKAWSRRVEQDGKPLRFTYPPRGWDFNVFVTAITPIRFAADESPAPEWELTLFPVGNGTRTIVDGIKDLYIERLMDGIGWSQTAYNGPTQQEVDDLLNGQTAEEYLKGQYQNAYDGGAIRDGGQQTTGLQ